MSKQALFNRSRKALKRNTAKVAQLVLEEEKFEWIEQIHGQFLKKIKAPVELRQEINDKKEQQRCLIHNIVYSIYCTICCKPLCASCMYQQMTHRPHHVIPLEKAYTYINQDIQTFHTKIGKMMTESQGIIKKNSESLLHLQKQINPLIFSLEEFYMNIRELMDAKQKQQIEYLNDTKMRLRNEMQSYSGQLSNINSYISSKLKIIIADSKEGEALFSRCINEVLLDFRSLFDSSSINYTGIRSVIIDSKQFNALQDQIMFKLTRIIPFLPIEISRIKQPKRSMNSASPKRVSFDVKKKTPPKSKDIDNNKSDLGKAGTFKAVFKKDRT